MARGTPTMIMREFHQIAVCRYTTDEPSLNGCATGDQDPDAAERESDQDPDAADGESEEDVEFYENSEIAWHSLPLSSDDEVDTDGQDDEDEDDMLVDGDGEQDDDDDEEDEDDDSTGAEMIAEEDMEEEMDYHNTEANHFTPSRLPSPILSSSPTRSPSPSFSRPSTPSPQSAPSPASFAARLPSPCSAPHHFTEITNTPGRPSRSRNKGKGRARAEDLDSEDSDSEWLPNSRAKRLPTRKSKVRPSAGPSPLQAGPSASRKRGRDSYDEAEYAPAQKVPRVRKTVQCRQPQTTSKKPKDPKESKPPKDPKGSKPPKDPKGSKPPKDPKESKPPKDPKESKLPQEWLRSLTTGSGQCSKCSQEFYRTTYPDYKAHMMSHDLSPLPKQLLCPLPKCHWRTPKRMAKRPTLKVDHLIEHTYDKHLSQRYRCVYWSTESRPCTWHADSAKRVAQQMEQKHGMELLIRLRGGQKTIEQL